jgi:hypothetical protein
LCEGPIAGVRKIWADGKLIYDASAANTGPASKYGDVLKIYLGSEDQLPDPTMESYLGVGNVPAYRGTAYLLLGPDTNFPLADFGNRVPNITAEVYTTGAPDYATVEVPSSAVHQLQAVGDPSRGFLYGLHQDEADGQDDRLIKVNALDNSLVYDVRLDLEDSTHGVTVYGATSAQGALAVDDLGNVYVAGAQASLWGWVSRLSPDSGLQAAESAHQTGTVGVLKPGPLILDPATGQDIGHLWVSYWGLGGDRVYNLWRQSLTLRWSASLPATAVQLAIDADENAWILLDDRTLVRATPAGELTTYSLAADFATETSFLAYDPTDRALLIGSEPDSTLIKWDLDSHSTVATLSTAMDAFNYKSFDRGVVGRSLWLTDTTVVKEIDADTLTVTRTIDPSLWVPGSMTGVIYDEVANALWVVDDNSLAFTKILLDRVEPGPVLLKDIVTAISQQVGIAASELEVEALTDEVWGYALGRRAPARAFLEPLRQGYLFDMVESDYHVKCPKRGADPVATLSADDLGAYAADGQPLEPWRERRLAPEALPARIDVLYLDPARDYQQGQQDAKRQDVSTAEEPLTIQLPIAFEATVAKQIAEKTLYLTWTERTAYETTLPLTYVRLDPGDVVQLTRAGVTYTVRVISTELGADYTIRLRALAEDAEIYASLAVGDDGFFPLPDVPSPAGTTALALLDIPILRDADDDAGLYAGLYGFSTAWPGAVLYKSADDALWTPQYSESDPVTVGVALTALAAGPVYTWDRTHTVRVQLTTPGASLESYTEAQVLNYANGAVLGSELIQWTDAQQPDPEQPNIWELSGLLRGRKGTEWAVGTHSPGERFVVLSASTIRRITADSGELNLSRYYRPVTIGSSLAATPSTTFVNTGVALTPYSPTYVRGSRNGSGDLTVTWLRRTRLSGEWLDGSGTVSLGEDAELYHLQILDAPGGDVVRNVTGLTSPTYTYVAAAQVTDFGSTQNTVYVKIMQVSTVVGDGYPEEATL